MVYLPVRSWWSCSCCIYGCGRVQQETEDGQWASIRPARVDSTKWHNTHTGARKWCNMLYSGWFARESSDWVMMQTVLFGFDSFLHFFSKFDGRIFLLWGLLKNDDFEAFLGPERGGPTSGLNHDKSRRGQANQVYSPCLRIMPFCKTSSLPCSFSKVPHMRLKRIYSTCQVLMVVQMLHLWLPQMPRTFRSVSRKRSLSSP